MSTAVYIYAVSTLEMLVVKHGGIRIIHTTALVRRFEDLVFLVCQTIGLTELIIFILTNLF